MIRIEEALHQVEKLYRSVTGRTFPVTTNSFRQETETAQTIQKSFEQRVDQLLHALHDPAITPTLAPWSPAIAIWENEQCLTISMDLPGVKKEEVDISMRNGLLTITGIRRLAAQDRQQQARLLETQSGHFQRSIVLPFGTVSTHVDSKLENGVLEIVLPKDKSASVKKDHSPLQ